MSKLIKHNRADTSVPWSEHDLQVACCQYLAAQERAGHLTYAADMNGLKTATKRGAALAKAAGMRAGEPDLRIYLPGGRLLLVELKRAKGRVSAAQTERHAALAKHGHHVVTIFAASPNDAISRLREAIIE